MYDGTMSWKPAEFYGDIYQRRYISDPNTPVPYTDGIQTHRTAEYMTDDQRFAAERPDVLTYQTDSLAHDVTLAGPVVANLYVAVNTTDADFVVKLIDVFPDNFTYNDSTDGKGNGKGYLMGGYQMLVRGEIMRGKYRKSFEYPQAFLTGEPDSVKFTLPDVAHVFKKGHRIMVQIQSTWFPLADRNSQQYEDLYRCDPCNFTPTTIHIHSDAKQPSNIVLPVLR